MSSGVVIGAVIFLAAAIIGLRARARLSGLRAGDLIRVPIPRTLDRPLAMGTRLDIAAALERAGVAREELRSLIDGGHDQELLDRYWSAQEAK